MTDGADPPPTAGGPGVTLLRLVVGDAGPAWAAAGFTVSDPATPGGPATVQVGSLVIELAGGDRRGLRSWALWSPLAGASGILDADGRLDGLRTELHAGPRPDEPARGAPHPNGVTDLDHLVLVSPDVERTTTALAAIGLDARRTRHTDQYGAPMVQRFFRAGPVIVELIGPPDSTPDAGRARFFGLAFTVDDLDATATQLGGHLGRIKDAVQPGRRIATLRHAQIGVTVPTAFMSADPAARPG